MSSGQDAPQPPNPTPPPTPSRGTGSGAARSRGADFDVEVTRRGSPEAANEPGPAEMTADVPETMRSPEGEPAPPASSFNEGSPLAWGSWRRPRPEKETDDDAPEPAETAQPVRYADTAADADDSGDDELDFGETVRGEPPRPRARIVLPKAVNKAATTQAPDPAPSPAPPATPPEAEPERPVTGWSIPASDATEGPDELELGVTVRGHQQAPPRVTLPSAAPASPLPPSPDEEPAAPPAAEATGTPAPVPMTAMDDLLETRRHHFEPGEAPSQEAPASPPDLDDEGGWETVVSSRPAPPVVQAPIPEPDPPEHSDAAAVSPPDLDDEGGWETVVSSRPTPPVVQAPVPEPDPPVSASASAPADSSDPDEMDLGVTRRGIPTTPQPVARPVDPDQATSRRPPDPIEVGATAAHTVQRRVIEREVDVDLGATLRGRGGAIGKAPAGQEGTLTARGHQPAGDPAAGRGFTTESALDIAATQRHEGGFAVAGGDETDFALGDTRRGDAMDAAGPDGETDSITNTRRSYLKSLPEEDKNLLTRTLEDLTYRFEIPEEELPQSDPATMNDPALKALMAWKERFVLVSVLLCLLGLGGALLVVFMRYARPKAWMAQQIENLDRDLMMAGNLNSSVAPWEMRVPLWEQEKRLMAATGTNRLDQEQEDLRNQSNLKALQAAEDKLKFLRQYSDVSTDQTEMSAEISEMQIKVGRLKESQDLLETIREKINRLPQEKLERFKFADFTERVLSDRQRAAIPLPNGAQALEMVWLPPSGNRPGFWVSRYEVTWAQYLAVMGDRGNGIPPSVKSTPSNYPAEHIWWTDAKRFCSALNRMTASGAPAANNYFYRLPTYAEWQAYSGSRGGGVFGRSGSAPVGTGGKNSLGLYDVWGNVAEWLEDRANRRQMNPEITLGFWDGEPAAAGGRYLAGSAQDAASKVMSAGSDEYVEFKRGGFGFRVVLAKK